MRELLFKFGGEVILVVIEGKNVRFGNTTYGGQLATIEGLKLNKNGVIKEFPDLKDKEDWRIEAISRFKEKLNSLDKEEEIEDYIIKDLKKFGYTPWKRKKKGFREEKL